MTPSETNLNPPDYRSTLNITLNDRDPGAFPQRGGLPQKEPIFQERWRAADSYRASLDRPNSRGTFVLHDGPPYSNGDIHLGHALNKIAKDMIVRLRSMQGWRAPYVPGWDNHGMPIENAVVRQFREAKQSPDRITLRKACRDYAAKWVGIQREQFQRLGIRGDWDDPYLTMDSEIEARIVEVFGELAAGGYIYRGLKPVLWCASCETALADAEVEYEPHTSSSIYVRFTLRDDPTDALAGLRDVQAIIWTTTPWTIPANVAIAVHPDADYAVVRAGGKRWLVAAPLVETVTAAAGLHDAEIEHTILGKRLEGVVFTHPLFDRPSPVVLASYVTMDTGTGLVHTAPGHGKEDFETGQRYDLEVLCPVDGRGRYTSDAAAGGPLELTGLRVVGTGGKRDRGEANEAILTALRAAGALLSDAQLEHSYPHCWRCHTALIYRATVQWFMSIDHNGHRDRALAALDEVTWYPPDSVNRIRSMVAGRPDWCVSRQRSWGVGIPAFYCGACDAPVLTTDSVAAVAALVRREGSDAWYAASPEEILPAGFACPACGAGAAGMRKETDVLDVWFDSGSTHRAVLEDQNHWPDLQWPADVYLEGGDQHRGWFNSSLMISAATRGAAPYRAVVTNGWTLDENGHAMHKSKGNVINPLVVVEKYGADVLRAWVASTNFLEDVHCGENVLKQAAETYRRIRNTFRFLINNLHDFHAEEDSVPKSELMELDRWALEALNRLVEDAVSAYDRYEFHRVYHHVHNFCTVELSAFYLDVLKDRLYASGEKSLARRSAQTVLHALAGTLARLLAPILVHTAEEVWDHLREAGSEASVHLAAMPEPHPADEILLERWAPVIEAREQVNRALEAARQVGLIGSSLEAAVVLGPSFGHLEPLAAALPGVFLVSAVTLGSNAEPSPDGVEVLRASGAKCARCWIVKTDTGSRPEHSDVCERCADVLDGLR